MNRDALAAALARLAALEASLAEGAEAEAVREREIARLTAEREALEREVADLSRKLHERAAPALPEPPARPPPPVDEDEIAALFAAAVAASRSAQPEAAMRRISEVLARDFHHAGARALLGTARCPRCRTLVLEPSPATAVADYARFWRGVCPRCEGLLALG